MRFKLFIYRVKFENSGCHILALKMDSPLDNIARNILYEMWFSVAETIFKQVCEETELNQEQIDALKSVALRPNDFQIEVE